MNEIVFTVTGYCLFLLVLFIRTVYMVMQICKNIYSKTTKYICAAMYFFLIDTYIK